MSARKSLVVFLLLLAVSLGQRHNLIQCISQPGDILLHKESADRRFSFLDYVSATVFFHVCNKTINCVKALDKWDDGTGGFAEITQGGIGYDHVKVKITSQFGRGFAFAVEVYGQ
ncbi:hypothetical protein Cfor_03229 [Coptotermes formosanus]|jgi:hypothetical protein|uniref:Salivary secreted peptide n=1 Tax=Coptotermes formosanus TaxID=36987 RepID=A0A6L2PEC4_COPFO|nr:hypothetical protein Cfor_03229 [Coptotermes formosanus]